jgi:peptide/nickel transport system permease protein
MGLGSYIIRRIMIMIPMFFLSTIVIFSLIYLAPGDPIEIMFTESGRPPPREIVEELREQFGLDRPIYIQYILWLKRLFTGDFGVSYSGTWVGFKIIDLMRARMGNTLILSITAQILSIIVAVIFGVIAAIKQYRLFDNVTSLTAIFGYSMPSFWLALLLLFTFGLRLNLFPLHGTHSVGEDLTGIAGLLDYMWHMALPLVTMMTGTTAWLFRMVRSSMLETLNQDYITTARVKGLKERVVIYKHALRNALMPVVTVIGLNAGFILGGAVITETIFAWPGMGRLTLTFALQRDYPGLMAISMIIIIMVYVATLITDIAYSLIDPRIKY